MKSGNIVIRFEDKPIYSNSEKRGYHQALISEIIRCFDSPELESKRLLFYFDQSSIFILKFYGRAFPTEFDYIRQEIAHRFMVFDADCINDYDFIVILSKDIFLHDDPISKTFTIAHELQHILQHVNHRCHALLNLVFFHYSWLIDTKGFSSIGMRLPNEYDARRKAKLINSRLYSKSSTNKFINEGLASEIGDKDYFQVLKEIDIEEEYDFVMETNKYWDKHYDGVIKRVDSIRAEATKSDYEMDLLRAYNLFAAECPDLSRKTAGI